MAVARASGFISNMGTARLCPKTDIGAVSNIIEIIMFLIFIIYKRFTV